MLAKLLFDERIIFMKSIVESLGPYILCNIYQSYLISSNFA